MVRVLVAVTVGVAVRVGVLVGVGVGNGPLGHAPTPLGSSTAPGAVTVPSRSIPVGLGLSVFVTFTSRQFLPTVAESKVVTGVVSAENPGIVSSRVELRLLVKDTCPELSAAACTLTEPPGHA
jgi:hypothetical protein